MRLHRQLKIICRTFYLPLGCLALIAVMLRLKTDTQPMSTSNSIQELPNIVFMLADDLGYGDVGYNGGPAETPNLDAMASSPHSIKFTHFYSGAPVCSPTRGTLLTGRNHNRYCLWTANMPGPNCKHQDDLACPTKMPLPTSEVTVAEILRDHGYHTATFGKWHLGDLMPVQGGNKQWPTSHPGQHGFDTWKVTKRIVPTANPNCACFNASLCRLGHYETKPPPPCANYYSGKKGDRNILTHRQTIIGDDSDFIVKVFAKFLGETAHLNQPFFVYIAFHAPHGRYIAVSPYLEKYKEKGYVQEDVDYYGTITAMDSAIGNIRALLRQHKLRQKTMLWFASDNGPDSKSPGRTAGLRGRKGSLYEGGIRVPGIIEWPGVIKHNRISAYPVVTSDFLPTVCDILGTNVPQDRAIDGISVLPVILGESHTEQRKKPIAWAFNTWGDFSGNYKMALVDNHIKVYADINDGKVTKAALYNLLADPTESQDVSVQNPQLLNSLLAGLDTWIHSVASSAEVNVGCTKMTSL